MANISTIKSGSLFAGNPIIVPVTAGSYVGVSFLRVKLKVSAELIYYTDDGKESVITYKNGAVFSSPAIPGEEIVMDISSALKMMAQGGFEYTREMTKYPYIKYKLTAWDEYLSGGDVRESSTVTVGGLQALLGGFSEEERFFNEKGSIMPVQFFSTKPLWGEVVSTDERLFFPIPFSEPKTAAISYGQQTKSFSFEGKKGKVDIMLSDLCDSSVYDYAAHPVSSDRAVHSVFVVPPSPDRYQFFFLNHLGVIETITAVCLPEESKKFKSSSYTKSFFQSFKRFSSLVMKKQAGGRVLKMSSGPLNEEWLTWWIDEFLASGKAWIRLNGKFYPCNIIVSENQAVRKFADEGALEVTFTVETDI